MYHFDISHLALAENFMPHARDIKLLTSLASGQKAAKARCIPKLFIVPAVVAVTLLCSLRFRASAANAATDRLRPYIFHSRRTVASGCHYSWCLGFLMSPLMTADGYCKLARPGCIFHGQRCQLCSPTQKLEGPESLHACGKEPCARSPRVELISARPRRQSGRSTKFRPRAFSGVLSKPIEMQQSGPWFYTTAWGHRAIES